MCCCVCCSVSDLFLYILAVFFPPVAVLLRSGFCSQDFVLNILLTLCGFLPGLIHAIYYITVTSPLRREAEYVYLYQSGWEDRERQGELARESDDVRRPLLEQQSYPRQSSPHDAKGNISNPPPYSEIP